MLALSLVCCGRVPSDAAGGVRRAEVLSAGGWSRPWTRAWRWRRTIPSSSARPLPESAEGNTLLRTRVVAT
eukprot:3894848-Rhodomonas_salina.1